MYLLLVYMYIFCFQEWKPAGCSVTIKIYTEALGHASQRFFLRQLVPVWHDLKEIMDISVIPFVKSKVRSYSLLIML